MSTTDKPYLSIISVGHTGCGKSTLHTYLHQQSHEESKQTTTIQCSYNEFFTKSYHCTLIDAPGKKKYIKNMMNGASRADVAILVISASPGEFETSIKKTPKGEARHHARLCHLSGIQQLIVCVNKMDDHSVNYNESRFKEIHWEVDKMLTQIGYKTKKIPFIPISAYTGDNIIQPSENMKWYKGYTVKIRREKIHGRTLLDAFENVLRTPRRLAHKPFRMPISRVYNIDGFCIVTGRIEQGSIQKGCNIKLLPSNLEGVVTDIQMHHRQKHTAECGDNVGIKIDELYKDFSDNDNGKQIKMKKQMLVIGYLRGQVVRISVPNELIAVIADFYPYYTLWDKVGNVMVINDNKVDPSPPVSNVKRFIALLFVHDFPGKIISALSYADLIKKKHGYTALVLVRTATAVCELIEIKWKMGKATLDQKVEAPSYVEAGDMAEVIFEIKKPIVICEFDECKPLGRFAVMDGNQMIMLGKVTSVCK